MKSISSLQALALPLVKILSSGHTLTASQLREAIANELNLESESFSQEQSNLKHNALDNQIDLALAFLSNSGLVESPNPETYTLSNSGKQLLQSSQAEPINELFAEENFDLELNTENNIQTEKSDVHHQLRNEISEKIKSLPPEDFKQFILSLRQLSIDSAQKITDQIPMDDYPETSNTLIESNPQSSAH